MIKRTMLILLVLFGAGTMFWLFHHFKDAKVTPITKEMPHSATPSRKMSDLPTQDLTETKVPESSRHAAGAVEQQRQDKLASLDQAVKNQETKVDERRKALANIVRTKGIIYKEGDAIGQSGTEENVDPKEALQTYHQLEQEQMQIGSQINSLLKYENEQLMVYAAGMDLPDNSVRTLYPQYLEAKRDLEALKINGLDVKHPTVISAIAQIDTIKRQLDEGVLNLRATLKAKLDLTTESLKSVETYKNKVRTEGIQRANDAQEYVDAKRAYETDQKLLQELKLKQASEKAKEKTGR